MDRSPGAMEPESWLAAWSPQLGADSQLVWPREAATSSQWAEEATARSLGGEHGGQCGISPRPGHRGQSQRLVHPSEAPDKQNVSRCSMPRDPATHTVWGRRVTTPVLSAFGPACPRPKRGTSLGRQVSRGEGVRAVLGTEVSRGEGVRLCWGAGVPW